MSKIPQSIDPESTEKRMGPNKTPLHVVLLQEIQRYNALLLLLRSSLKDLCRAIKGQVVMTEQLEEIFICMSEGRVPPFWSRAYSSLKPLAAWTRDLVLRIEYFAKWAETTEPPTLFWLAAFTFPTGFLTAVLQTAARQRRVSVDSLTWEFIILTEAEGSIQNSPTVGSFFSQNDTKTSF